MKVIRYPEAGIKGIVKRILLLIKNGNINMDGTPEEILKSEPLAELVYELNWLQNKVESLEAQNVEKIQENSKLMIQIQSMKEGLQGKVDSLQHQQSYLVAQNAEMSAKIQSMKEEVDRKTMEQEKLTEVCGIKIDTLCNTFSARCISDDSELQNLRQYLSELDTEMANKISQNNSNIPQPASFKITITDLTNASFLHMLILSFFVSCEKLPSYSKFRKSPTQETLYSTVCCLQIFFGLLILIAFPIRKSNTVIQYVGILIANCAVASLMCALIHYLLGILTVLWWLVCLRTVYGRIWLEFKSELGSLFDKDKERMIANVASQGETEINQSQDQARFWNKLWKNTFGYFQGESAAIPVQDPLQEQLISGQGKNKRNKSTNPKKRKH